MGDEPKAAVEMGGINVTSSTKPGQGLEQFEKRVTSKMCGMLALAVLVLLGGNAAFTAAVVGGFKDFQVVGGVLKDKDGKNTVQVSSAGTSGSLASSNAASPPTSPTATSPTAGQGSVTLDSRLPDAVWKELKRIEFTSPDGGYLQLLVTATVRDVVAANHPHEPLHGSIVTIHTSVGEIKYDGPLMTFHSASSSTAFANAGFTVTPNRRRLMSAVSMTGVFDNIPSFANWPTKYDSPPKIPSTYKAQLEYLHACQHDNQDLCDFFGVPATHLVDEAGNVATGMTRMQRLGTKLFARVTSELWEDGASNQHKEVFADLANFKGWTYEKTSSATPGHSDVAQTWTATGQRYFCKTEYGTRAGLPDAANIVASYKGQITFQGQPAARFLLKPKDNSDASIEMITSVPDETGGVVSVVPKQVNAVVSDAQGGKVRHFTVNYKTLVEEAIPASTFSWGLSGGAQFENKTVCAGTVDYTPDPAHPHHSLAPIPIEAMLKGTSPFYPFHSAPDSTVFFNILQEKTDMTAAEFAALNMSKVKTPNHKSIIQKATLSGRLSPGHATEHKKHNDLSQPKSTPTSSRRSLMQQAVPALQQARPSKRGELAPIKGRTFVNNHSTPRSSRALSALSVEDRSTAFSSSNHRALASYDCQCFRCSDAFCASPNCQRCSIASDTAATECPSNQWGCYTTAAAECNCDAASGQAAQQQQVATDADTKQTPQLDDFGVPISASNCNLNKNTDGNCPDSCFQSISDWISPLEMPCDVTFSAPHTCSIEASCESGADIYYPTPAGPLKMSVGGSITLDCTPDWSRCDVVGCIDFDMSLSVRGVPFEVDFAQIQACYATRVLPCPGLQKMFELSITLGPLAGFTFTGTADLFERTPLSCTTDAWGQGEDKQYKVFRMLITITFHIWPITLDVYNGYIIGA